VSATNVRLLQAAAEVVGGEEALAQRLGVTHARLAMFLTNRIPLPDSLLLVAVDIILDDRRARGGLPMSELHDERRRT